jgi:DNA-binding transcriptional MerR regulator
MARLPTKASFPIDVSARYTAREVEQRTGVPASTLRQWERRYGIPNPQRNASGYRLYSLRELEQIQFIQSCTTEGIAVGRAVELCRERETPQPGLVGDPSGLELASRSLLEAVLHFEHDRASQILSDCHRRFSVEDVLTMVVAPALVHLGHLWERGEITIAHEHQASAYLRGRVQMLLDLVGQPSYGPSVVVCCGPGELHEMGPLMLAVLLRRTGIRAHYLGADTPLADLGLYSRQVGARAILISLGSGAALAATRAQLKDLGDLDLPVVYGGSLIGDHPELATQLGGQFLGNDPREVVGALRALLAGQVGE